MSLTLTTPTSFPAFPFTPYDIQLDLMRHLYTTIEGRKVSIVESPTGTGKTLSLLCASLTWLHSRALKGKLAESVGSSEDGPEWVRAQTLERRRREMEAEAHEYEERLAEARKREEKMRRAMKGRVRKRAKIVHEEGPSNDQEDDDAFLPDSEGEDPDDELSNLSPAVRALMQRFQHGSKQKEEIEPVCMKIYYASRTHSQLAQVLHELRKLKFPNDISITTTSVLAGGSPSSNLRPGTQQKDVGEKRPRPDEAAWDNETERYVTRTVSLGSRKQLCINEPLRERATDLDEACRQMLSEKGKKRCAHLPLPEDEMRMLDLRDQILATPKDIEDLVVAGQAADTCPYFGSRKAIPQAQLVLLPYNLLLQKTAREALGIDLTDQVVIIDEAHNLISTLLSLSTTRLPFRTLSAAHHQLSLYLTRFKTRLATTHSLHLKRLIGLLDGLVKFLEEWRDSQNQKGKGVKVEVMTVGELMSKIGRKFEGVNLLEVEKYLRDSKIARKISGYSVKALEKAAGQDPAKLAKLARLSNSTPPLHAVENFITALTAANDDGRISIALVDAQVEIKYQHLNPATHFTEVVELARSVVLAGGTMSPIADVTNQLFAQLPQERLDTFSCGHIVPATSLQTLVLKKSPRGGELQFRYEQQRDPSVIAELGQVLLNFVNVVPGGMVVFVPSYAFLNVLKGAWETSGLLNKLRGKKKVFFEPQESGQVETTLKEYAAEVNTLPNCGVTKKAGALLFAVIGAKLSEGLNFTDDLARAVVIVGLPFPNKNSPELRERMNYVNRLAERRTASSPAGSAKQGATKDAASELYENMCMNAVNQSIGRAIRHRGDWASLILLDCRYTSPRIRNKLPKWIGTNTTVAESFGQAMKEMGKFFREKRDTGASVKLGGA